MKLPIKWLKEKFISDDDPIDDWSIVAVFGVLVITTIIVILL